MCGNPFKKPKAPDPVEPPAPAAPAPEKSAATNQGTPQAAATDGANKIKRKGRNSLRIDLNTSGMSGGSGLNIPR